MPDFRIAGTTYDSDDFRARVAKQGSITVIPSNPSRAQAIAHDKQLYKERHGIECFINKTTHFRRIAPHCERPRGTRSGNTPRNMLAVIHLAPLTSEGLN